MTRKQRSQSGNSTYNLSNARNVAAFEALLEEEEREDVGRQSKASPQQPPSGRKKREKEKFFKLKSDDRLAIDNSSTSAPHQQSLGTLQQLQDMFSEAADPSVIADIYQAVGSHFEAAVEALFGLLGTAGKASPPSSSSSSSAGAGGLASSSAAAYSSHPSSSSSGSHGSGLHWTQVPDDIKMFILSFVPLRELARVAHACREFYTRCSSLRDQVHHLALPPGLSYSAIVGMVCSHTSASVVDMSRLERKPARTTPAHPQRKELPQVVVMQKQEAEAELFRALVAVAEAAASPSRQQAAVKGLVLKGLVGATDRLLAEALQQLKGLRSVDVSHCPYLTNKSLYQLAKYQASHGLQEQQQGEQEGVSGDDDEIRQWEATGGWMLSESSDDDDYQSSSSSGSAEGDDVGAEDEFRQAEPDEPGAAQVQDVEQPGQATADEPWPAVEQAGEEDAQPPPGDTSAEVEASSSRTRGDAGLQGVQNAQGAASCQAARRPAAFADDGLRQLLQGPVTKHSLTKLDVSRCPGFSQAGLSVSPLEGFPPEVLQSVLRELRASHCKGLTQLVIQLPTSHPLALLDLSGCHYLRLVDLAVKGLQQLNLNACRTLYRLRVR
eukprot:gene12817-12944_t